MMIHSKIYKGIEYVELSELPSSQREIISKSLNSELLIKIMIDGKIINECLQYKDYSFWYNSVFKSKHELVTVLESSPEQSVNFEAKLAYK